MNKHIRVVTPITTRGFRKAADFDGLAGPGVTISHVEIDRGPASIECEYDEMLAIPDTVRCIVEAEREGVQAVVIDCMGDPGMKAGRECVSIPVIGPCEAAMHLASMLGHTFSVVTVLKRLRVQFENQARLYGCWDKYASTRAVDIPVLALEGDPKATRRTLTEQALIAVEEDGADAIIFGCTGMLGCAEAVREGLMAKGYDIPVIDPVPAAVRLASALIDIGISHSRVAYAPPPAKPVVGYGMPDLSLRQKAAE
jgi:allantoin racemase